MQNYHSWPVHIPSFTLV